MDPILITIAYVAGGLAIGVLFAWLLARNRITALRCSLQERGEEVEAFDQRLEAIAAELNEKSNALMAQTGQLAAAESRLEHMQEVRSELEAGRREIQDLKQSLSAMEKAHAVLETASEKEKAGIEEKLAMLQDIQSRLPDLFRSISVQTMQDNNQSFLDLATATLGKYLSSATGDLEKRQKSIGDTVKPIHDALERFDRQVTDMEKARENAYGRLTQHLASLTDTQTALQKETARLVKALREPHVRGRWGELTLKRVAEISGMQDRCDFQLQATAHSDDGILRPDMIIHLPGGRRVVVDAKAPLTAYLSALEADQENERQSHMADHARQLQTHIQKLSLKAYWQQFQPTPEFVIMFIPGENFFSAALSQNPELIEGAAAKGIVLATPTTLISLLKTVALAWRQEAMAENARIVSDLGAELYRRLTAMARHLSALGRDIDRTTGTFNKLVGSYERRVLPAARKFDGLGIVSGGEESLPEISTTDERPRTIDHDPSESSN